MSTMVEYRLLLFLGIDQVLKILGHFKMFVNRRPYGGGWGFQNTIPTDFIRPDQNSMINKVVIREYKDINFGDLPKITNFAANI